jgi:hypothetical protein
MSLMYRRLLCLLVAFCLLFTQTAQAYSLAQLPHSQHINNQGDLGKTLDDMGKSENVKALVTAMVTAGVLSQLNQTLNLSNVNAQSGFADQLQKNLINQSSSALINHAINGGDLSKQLEQSLKSAFIDTGAAQGANFIGDLKQNGTLDTYTHKLAHAIAGCAAGAAKSNDCSSGALGAVVGEITAELYAPNNTGTPLTAKQQTDTINFSKMIAGVAAALTGNNVNVAAGAAGNAAENNWLNHNRPSLLALSEKERYDQAAKDCGSGNAAQCSVATNLRNLSNDRDRQLNLACAGAAPSSTCAAAAKEAILAGNDVFTGPDGRLYATSKTLPTLSNPDRPQGFDQKIAPSVIDAALLEAGNGVIAGVVKGGAAAMEVLGLSAREVGAGIANPVSATLARVVPSEIDPMMLGSPSQLDVFVTNANELYGLSAKDIAQKLTIPNSPSGFRVIEFPSADVQGIASPVFRTNPGFVGGGKTAGGASEFVIPNSVIPTNATQRVVP